MPKIKEIQHASEVLQGLLASELLTSPSIQELLGNLPTETEFEALSNPRIEDLTTDLLDYINSAVQYLNGMLTGVPPFAETDLLVAAQLTALLTAALAFDLPIETREEYNELLANCRKIEALKNAQELKLD